MLMRTVHTFIIVIGIQEVLIVVHAARVLSKLFHVRTHTHEKFFDLKIKSGTAKCIQKSMHING